MDPPWTYLVCVSFHLCVELSYLSLSDRDELVWVVNADGSPGCKSKAGFAVVCPYLSCTWEAKTERGAPAVVSHPDGVSHMPNRVEQFLLSTRWIRSFLIQPTMLLAFYAVRARGWLTFPFLSPRYFLPKVPSVPAGPQPVLLHGIIWP